MIEKISKIINLTQTELKIILFLVVTLLCGLVLKFALNLNEKSNISFYDYTQIDSIFYADSESHLNNSQFLNKKVDYKQEVFDFNTRSFNNISKKQLPAEKSINLNKASKYDLMMIPGIGGKTAEEIINLRKKNNGFRKPEDLLKVKGIGLKKLDIIKKYIFVE